MSCTPAPPHPIPATWGALAITCSAYRLLYASGVLEIRLGLGKWVSASPLPYLRDGNFHQLIATHDPSILTPVNVYVSLRVANSRAVMCWVDGEGV